MLGETKHWGIEFMLGNKIYLNYPFPGSMDVNVNYTWSSNIFVDFIDNEQVFNGNKLPGIPSNGHTPLLNGNH